MSDGIITSRRSFLKMFGATALVAAAPIPLVLAEAVAPPLAEAALPPNVLHVMDGGAWRAVSEVIRMSETQQISYVDIASLGERSTMRKFKGARSHELAIEGLVTSEFDVLERALDSMQSARYAISLQGCAYEFNALLTQLARRFEPDAFADYAAVLAIRDVEMRLLDA